jgi:hypothetical protein
VDVVVVEDHRRRHGREQPADRRARPGLAVELRVLLEVGDLLAGRLADVAPLRMTRASRRDLVGVDLVAEQQIRCGQSSTGSWRMRSAKVAQGVDLATAVVLVLASASRAARAGRRRGRSPRRSSPGARGRGCAARWAGTASPPAARHSRRRDGPRTASPCRAPAATRTIA